MVDKKQKISSRYDKWTRFYDKIDSFPLVSRPQKRWKRRAVDELSLMGDERVLDIGTGTGEILPWIVQSLDGGEVIGTDISQAMIERARARVEKENIMERARLNYDDIEESDYPDDHFDRIISTFTLTTVPHPEKALEESARLLKEDGKMIILDTGWPDHILSKLLFVPMMLSAKLFGRTHMDRDIPGMVQEVFRTKEIERNMAGMVYLIVAHQR